MRFEAASGRELWRHAAGGKAFADARLAVNGEFIVAGTVDGNRADMLSLRYPVNFTTPSALPAAPTGLTLTSAKSRLTLQWLDNASNETGYRVERAVNGGSFAEIAQVAANARNFTDSGLSKAQTYSYRVRALNGGGFSAYSNTATGRPK